MSGPTNSTVLYREEGGLGFITFNRPEKLNALNPQVLDDLEAAMDQFDASPDALVGVVSGAGKAFLAGADIEHYVGLTIHEYREFMIRGKKAQDRLVFSPKVLVAAVHGYALGGGLEIALCCDLIVAERDAQLGLPEVKLGLLPGGGGSQRLPGIIGARRAVELLTTGRSMTAQEAADWGVVNRIAEPGQGMSVATELAAQLSRRAPLAVRLAKRLVRDGAGADLETALSLEHAETAALYLTADATEGIDAFVHKRRPDFRGN